MAKTVLPEFLWLSGPVFEFSEEDFLCIERAGGKALNPEHREQLTQAVRDYICWRSMEEAATPAADKLKDLGKKPALASGVPELKQKYSEIDAEYDRCREDIERRTIGSSGPRSSRPGFWVLVDGAAEVFRSAGGSPSIYCIRTPRTWQDELANDRWTPFARFVRVICKRLAVLEQNLTQASGKDTAERSLAVGSMFPSHSALVDAIEAALKFNAEQREKMNHQPQE